ncbi:BolA family protein [Legionella israelensis]|uniref:Regulator of penicillin binding proteins and beta lactamase transcription (Morphogene) n=1 Tax=Legionella israelensis TaxID=454 RepID=A0A0W0VHQ4_9GAMM|nr:BolA family protein [Legionella israelensis]KTD19634.1 regulator of penicillin binding proteins and beta lactamase transcription (morphogene) [Legionella israelensis]SCY43478.1 transcriptional regulator, BolA protein family [Legionella israelensis DSM 19235]STX58824.1 regulator of penicillin binding proteins and beta lactamase transcription (morphogene) [Legionella israelensis]
MMNRKERIYECLQKELHPETLEVKDESSHHHVPEGAETHYKITMVSEQFRQKTRLQRHRQINQLLSEEFERGMHALSLCLYTPEEWQKISGTVSESPACRGGYQSG